MQKTRARQFSATSGDFEGLPNISKKEQDLLFEVCGFFNRLNVRRYNERYNENHAVIFRTLYRSWVTQGYVHDVNSLAYETNTNIQSLTARLSNMEDLGYALRIKEGRRTRVYFNRRVAEETMRSYVYHQIDDIIDTAERLKALRADLHVDGSDSPKTG